MARAGDATVACVPPASGPNRHQCRRFLTPSTAPAECGQHPVRSLQIVAVIPSRPIRDKNQGIEIVDRQAVGLEKRLPRGTLQCREPQALIAIKPKQKSNHALAERALAVEEQHGHRRGQIHWSMLGS